MKAFKIHETALGVTGTGVKITYKLVKTGDVSMADLSIGHTPIDLKKDQDKTDNNVFQSKNDSQYLGLWEGNGILVTAHANGKAGGNWKLTISVNGTPLNDDPIKESTDGNGHLDHNAKHN
ncbi:hypothetical protein [Mucilaginibacter auburnensis]|uniref:Uncharacterized protein n=1 Tax=Mucilaginibacter auburnensis TaxID=1457233 RepID=A0A2H9VP97_9SPHI|nr:hypothetical protein [Mucilaginibacter auburnensis]PJJ80179.1 hypothetical protein CLV57_3326 [Mucilaginibacter auburnensis]